MRNDILAYIQSCTVCTQAKLDRASYPGLLQPLPVPRQSWAVVSLDFVEGLLLSGTFSAILVVVDKFSNVTHFIPLKHPYSAASVAQLFLDNVFKLHGLLIVIISDHDKVFTSKFGSRFFNSLALICV
jgi:hypothetical protein